MTNEYIDTELNKVRKLVSSYDSEWDHAYGQCTFEFYPNKMTSMHLYLEKKGTYKNLMIDDEFSHDFLSISSDIRDQIESDDTFSKLPDQLLFKMNRKVDKAEYHFVYDIADKPNYSSFNEMLYFEYHLMGLIPEDSFNKKLLNNALRYHGEKPLD